MTSKTNLRGWWVAVLAGVVLASAGWPRPPEQLETEPAAADVETASTDDDTSAGGDVVAASRGPTRNDDEAVRKCRNGCNSRCHGAKNKSKCVNECRRACEGR